MLYAHITRKLRVLRYMLLNFNIMVVIIILISYVRSLYISLKLLTFLAMLAH